MGDRDKWSPHLHLPHVRWKPPRECGQWRLCARRGVGRHGGKLKLRAPQGEAFETRCALFRRMR